MPITEDFMIDMLNELQIRCTACGQTRLERGSFNDHIIKSCPISNVICSSTNIGCSWKESRDQLQQYLITFVLQPVRSVVVPLIAENRQLKEQVNQLKPQTDRQQNEIRQFEYQIKQQRVQIEKQQNERQQLKEQIMRQETKKQVLPNKAAGER
jgi:predicted RNase H-like nuclease (RuvC/YqgF family)